MRTMDLLVAAINAMVVAVVAGVVTWLFKGRFDGLDLKIDALDTRLTGQIHSVETQLDGRIGSFEARLDGRIASLEARLDGRIDTLQSSMDSMRSDLTQVALAVGVRPRARND
jgi:hypothetical protein